MDSGLTAVFGAVGRAKLARALGVSPAAVSQWTRVPAARVLDVERISGVHRYVIRPDLYPVHDYAKGFLEEGHYE